MASPTPSPASGSLVAAMVRLAGTPDHSPDLPTQMVSITRLTGERVKVARFASITALRGKAHTTVAVSDELIRAVDEIQYADDAGPCLDAVDSGTPVGVPDIDATVRWPGFREVAPRLGLHASVSVPLYSGRGAAVAALNVYGDDRAAMAPLIAGIWAVHRLTEEEGLRGESLTGLDPGSRELVTGYAEALRIRSTIRLALETIRSDNRCSPEDAYLSLCIQAGDAGTDLAEAATTLLDRNHPPT